MGNEIDIDYQGGFDNQKGKKKRTRGYDSESRPKCAPEKRLTITKEPKEEKKLCVPRRNFPRAATRRIFGPIDIHDSSSESGSSGEDSSSCFSDFEEEIGVRRIHRGDLHIKAFVVNAEDNGYADGVGGVGNGGFGKEEVKDKIRKMLELGLHSQTPEFESQQALKNAQRLLTKYNLQQAQVMEGALKDSEALVGGMSVVELRSNPMIGEIDHWVIVLALVIAGNFDIKYFSQTDTRKNHPPQVVFYGIKQNAECSGYAFAAAFNRITVMSAKYTPAKSLAEKNKEPVIQGTYKRIARNNYKLGIVVGLLEAVKKSSERLASEGQAKRIEDKQTEAMQALVLHSKNVGEAYIKKKGIDPRSFTVRSFEGLRDSLRNAEAFTHGKKDSKQIDINQKALPTSHREKFSKK